MTAQIFNVSRNCHHLRINGLVAAYINCDNGAWYAQGVTRTNKAPHFFELTGDKVFMSRVDVMDEDVVCKKLSLELA